MELKDLQHEMQSTLNEFRQYVDRELKEVKANGVAAPETKEALDRANNRISELQSNIEGIETKLNRSAASLGEQKPEQGIDAKAQNAYLTKGWTSLQGEMLTKALSVGSDPDGGYWVTPHFGGVVAQKLFDTTPMRQICNVESISTATFEGLVDNDEVTTGWVAETGTRSVTATPALKKLEIPTHEMYASPRTTQKLIDDAGQNVEMWLAAKVSDKFARVQNDAFINGAGVTKPRGFATYTTAATSDATRSWGQLEHVKTTANGDFATSNPADQIFSLVYALKAGYRQGASFLMPKAVLLKIRKFKESTTNAYIWQPGLQAGEPAKLLGYPVVESEDMPALGTGSLSLAFGNFKVGYTIVDRMGIRVLRDPYTVRPYIEYYTTARVGGDVTNFEAIKFLNFSA